MAFYNIEYDLRGSEVEPFCYWSEFYYLVMLTSAWEFQEQIETDEGTTDDGETFLIIRKKPSVQVWKADGTTQVCKLGAPTALVRNNSTHELWIGTIGRFNNKISLGRKFGMGLSRIPEFISNWKMQIQHMHTNDTISTHPLANAYNLLNKARGNKTYELFFHTLMNTMFEFEIR